MMFIGRVQGAIGQFQEIRQSTKAMNDVSPAHLLLCAAQAIAAAMSAPSIAGVSNQGQIAKTRGRRAEYEFDYDAFWMDFGFDKPNPDFFESPTIFKQRPLDQIPRSHRRRTRLKREFKDGVARRVKAAFTETVLSATLAAPQDDPS